MTILLLIIIYLSFISLGLPDSLFGSSWPLLHELFNVPISYAGFVTITISLGTIISSIFSDKLTSRFGAGKVTAISVLMTSIALIGFSLSNSLIMMILFAIPLGLGAGAVDAALNNYVALHFASKHMNWLHCFWGVGASISPYIMSFWISQDNKWENGYLTVGIIQLIITIFLFISLPLWKKNKIKENVTNDDEIIKAKPLKQVFRLPGVFYVLFAFLAYCAIETCVFAWTSSYLVLGKDFTIEIAAKYSSLFYLGMTISRFLSGFISDKLKDKNMIRLGYIIIFLGILLILIPFSNRYCCLLGLFLLGIGCGPIYPSIIHSTPNTFGKENSQAVIGIQMAFAYFGSTFSAPLFGIIANHISIKLFPLFLIMFALIGFILIELSFKTKRVKK